MFRIPRTLFPDRFPDCSDGYRITNWHGYRYPPRYDTATKAVAGKYRSLFFFLFWVNNDRFDREEE